MIKKIIIIVAIFCSTQVWAYPNYIGHGYPSCLNCHFNPFGNGPLNDYGRAISATLVSARWPYPKTWTEEDLAAKSGFLFEKPKQNWLRAQVNYRRFRLTRNPGSKNNETEMWITMQADARVIAKFGQNDKFTAVFNYGFAPAPLHPVPGVAEQNTWRSREHYMGYRFSPKVGVYAGLMDKVYGIRIIEHVSFSRTLPQVAQNDQTHGMAMHYLSDKWEGGFHGFVGNLSQDAPLRMKGISTMWERSIDSGHRVGGSYLNNSNEFYNLSSLAAHTRLNLKEGSALMAETGQVLKSIKSTDDEIKSRYALLQAYIRPGRGVYILNNIEYARANLEKDTYIIRWGPGLQMFPAQRTEFRMDIYNTRVFGTKTSVPDSWMLLLQTHLWL